MSSKVLYNPKETRNHPGHIAAVPADDIGANFLGCLVADPHQMQHIRVSAEAAHYAPRCRTRARGRQQPGNVKSREIKGDYAEPLTGITGVCISDEMQSFDGFHAFQRVCRQTGLIGRQPYPCQFRAVWQRLQPSPLRRRTLDCRLHHRSGGSDQVHTVKCSRFPPVRPAHPGLSRAKTSRRR